MAGVGVPLLVLAIGLGYLLVEREKRAFLATAADRSRVLMRAVDSELRGHSNTLAALATARSLDRGDLRAFHDDAARALKSQPDWANVILALPSGDQLVNPKLPFGNPLPRAAEVESLHRAMDTSGPVVGRLSPGPLTGAYAVPLRVSVMKRGRAAYVLTAAIRPEAFEKLVDDGSLLHAEWAVDIVDDDARVVARIPRSGPGIRASELQAAIRESVAGWRRTRTPDRGESFLVHTTSSFSGWTVALAIPSDEVHAGARRVFWYVAIAVQTALLLVGVGIVWLRRHVSHPIAELAAAGGRLGAGHGQPPVSREPAIDELRRIARALEQADETIAGTAGLAGCRQDKH